MVELYDTTLRDGTQGEGISLSVEDKLLIAKRLDRFGIHYIEGGFPGSNPKDMEFFQRVREIALTHAKVVAFGSTCRAGVEAHADANLKALLAARTEVVTIFGKSWTFHVQNALRTTLDENLRMIEDTVRYLVSNGVRVVYDAEHFYDGFKADPDYALASLRAAAQGGADTLALCDTNGGSLPTEVLEITRRVVEEFPELRIGVHTHNDGGLAVANTLMAVEAGGTHVQGTINGFGERNGNADLIQVIANLQLKMKRPVVSSEQLRGLTDLSRFVSEVANVKPDDRQPFVGRSVFAHKAGVHVSALLRHPETYEHIDPEVVGNKRRVLVSELSGASNILYKAQELGIPLQKDSPELRRVVETVKRLESEGYHFEGAEGSFELLLKKAVGQYEPFFHLLGFRTINERHDVYGNTITSEASVKLQVGSEILHTVGEGNGPVNALDSALRKALEGVYPDLRRIRLADYKVRVLNERAGTGAKVRVLITSREDGRSWGTVGVSTNIIEASWQALVDSIEYGLMLCGVRPLERAAVGG